MKHTWIVAALLLAGPAFAGDTSKIQTYQLKIEPLPEHSNCTQGAMDVQGNCIFPWPKETQKAPDAGKYMVDVGRQRVAEWHVLVINMSGSGMPLDGAAVIADEGFSMCGPLVFRDPKNMTCCVSPLASVCLHRNPLSPGRRNENSRRHHSHAFRLSRARATGRGA